MQRLKNAFLKLYSFIKVDYSFVLVFFLAIMLEELRVYFLFIIFVTLHEIMHLLVAKKLGYFPTKLKLSIFGASLEGFDDFLVKDEIKIILIGPLFNLLIVVICYLAFWFYPESYEWLESVLLVNKLIVLFNLLPVFPLDVGRLILALISRQYDRTKALCIVKRISLFFIFVLFLISIIYFKSNFAFSLGFAAINLCVLLFESSRGTSYKREIIFNKKIDHLKKGLPVKTIYLKYGVPLSFLLKFLDSDHYFEFVLVDDDFAVKEVICERELLDKLGFLN